MVKMAEVLGKVKLGAELGSVMEFRVAEAFESSYDDKGKITKRSKVRWRLEAGVQSLELLSDLLPGAHVGWRSPFNKGQLVWVTFKMKPATQGAWYVKLVSVEGIEA